MTEYLDKTTPKGDGAPDETQWLSTIPDADPMFIGIVGLADDVKVTIDGRDYIPLGSADTFSHPKDKS
jgi:hypothetical protein